MSRKPTVCCPWCHASVELVGAPNLALLCQKCGHMADRPRLDCKCPKCFQSALAVDLCREAQQVCNADPSPLAQITLKLANLLREHIQNGA